MRFKGLGVALLILSAEAARAQSLGDLARKERERKAQQGQKPSIQLSTDEIRSGKLDLSPPLDPARKRDLDYLLQQLSHPKPSTELLAALIPLKESAVPKLVSMLGSADSFRRIAPAVALIVLGNSGGLDAMARLLVAATEPADTPTPPAPAPPQATAKQGDKPSTPPAGQGAANPAEKTSVVAPSDDAALRKKMEQNRLFGYALGGTKLGVWRFTEASALAADQVVERLSKGPAIELVGGVDNGQRVFNRALRDQDPNLRRGAIALIRLASGGTDYGFQPDQDPDRNESAIQQITSFLTTERGKVVSELGSKAQ